MRRTLSDFRTPALAVFENQFGFRIGGLISHQFFTPCAVSFDLAAMKLFLKSN